MKRNKRHFTDSYEKEIKISLVLLIGFLLSLNFISSYSLGKARRAQHAGYISRLELALEFLQRNIKMNPLRLPEAGTLKDIVILAGIDGAQIDDNIGKRIMSVSVVSHKPEETKNLIVRTAPVCGKDGEVLFYISVSGINREGVNLHRLALFDSIFRVSGLIAGLLVAFLFIRSVLNPYRKIKKEASRLNLPQVDFDNHDDVEYAVRTFQEVIRELKEKEILLQAMYDSSEKRADSLARYNEYILGSISSGVIICDRRGIITRFNRAAERILGISQRRCQGRHFGEVLGRKHKISKILNEGLNRDVTYSRTEFEITLRGGEKLWIGLSSSLISDDDDNKIGAAVLLTDLTKIKKLQEISDFTEKMAALGEMSAGLAHELRNSVAAIMGFGKLLKKMLTTESKASTIADLIISESLATEEMLGKFLNFARPLKVTYKKVNVAQLTRESLNLANDMSKSEKIEVIMTDNSNGLAIDGDPVLLKTAFSNLIINAFQAMEETGRLNITVDHIENVNRIEIKISDTGKGIARQNMSKIFNPFFTTKDKGTGLGLALVRKIVNGHGGTIDVESCRGKGATFIVSLPVEAVERSEDKQKKSGDGDLRPKTEAASNVAG